MLKNNMVIVDIAEIAEGGEIESGHALRSGHRVQSGYAERTARCTISVSRRNS